MRGRHLAVEAVSMRFPQLNVTDPESSEPPAFDYKEIRMIQKVCSADVVYCEFEKADHTKPSNEEIVAFWKGQNRKAIKYSGQDGSIEADGQKYLLKTSGEEGEQGIAIFALIGHDGFYELENTPLPQGPHIPVAIKVPRPDPSFEHFFAHEKQMYRELWKEWGPMYSDPKKRNTIPSIPKYYTPTESGKKSLPSGVDLFVMQKLVSIPISDLLDDEKRLRNILVETVTVKVGGEDVNMLFGEWVLALIADGFLKVLELGIEHCDAHWDNVWLKTHDSTKGAPSKEYTVENPDKPKSYFWTHLRPAELQMLDFAYTEHTPGNDLERPSCFVTGAPDGARAGEHASTILYHMRDVLPSSGDSAAIKKRLDEVEIYIYNVRKSCLMHSRSMSLDKDNEQEALDIWSDVLNDDNLREVMSKELFGDTDEYQRLMNRLNKWLGISSKAPIGKMDKGRYLRQDVFQKIQDVLDKEPDFRFNPEDKPVAMQWLKTAQEVCSIKGQKRWLAGLRDMILKTATKAAPAAAPAPAETKAKAKKQKAASTKRPPTAPVAAKKAEKMKTQEVRKRMTRSKKVLLSDLQKPEWNKHFSHYGSLSKPLTASGEISV
mmetsp:Transcript_859/g.1921  ORF Transcript_859/g.1921 Transcript_859/m.1921 type:complete len:603 (-) Transcript_859:202-2010(-)